jgi:uncharacterized protein
VSIVLDTGLVVALIDRDDRHHEAALTWVAAVDDDLVTTPLALAEMDYFAHRLGGPRLSEALWDDFDSSVYSVRWWADGLLETTGIARRYGGFIGLTDASLIALASRLHTNRIATTDHRHFREATTVRGNAFVVLPADAA